MKTINNFIIEKLHLRKDNKDLKPKPDCKVTASKIYDNIYKDYENKRDMEVRVVLKDWLEDNEILRFKSYYDNAEHLGGGVNTAFGSFEYNPKKVKQILDESNENDRVMKCLFSSLGFVIMVDKEDAKQMFIRTPDTMFIITKEK